MSFLPGISSHYHVISESVYQNALAGFYYIFNLPQLSLKQQKHNDILLKTLIQHLIIVTDKKQYSNNSTFIVFNVVYQR